MRMCGIEGCDRTHYARGWCQRHWVRWRKYGDPLGKPKPRLRANCSVPGCERLASAHGWCTMHFLRVKNTGSPGEAAPRVRRAPGFGKDPEQRFWFYVRKTATCWKWTGPHDRKGYGAFSIASKKIGTHRYAFFLEHGRYPEAPLVIDHICSVPDCVRPSHLREVTQAENLARGTHTFSRLRSDQDFCKHGHAYTEENTYRSPKNGSRQCVQCRQDANVRCRSRRQ